MKKRNGFTLIELLAVIVILAVIALIAVPRIIELLDQARLSAAEDTTYGIVEAAESYMTDLMLKNHGTIPSENLIFECNSEGCIITNKLEGYNKENLEELKFKGKKPTSGTITISNGGKNIQVANLNINGFTCNHINDETYCGTKEYNSGDTYQLGDYNWHVISDDGKYLTLLMDANQLSNMKHCTDDTNTGTDCGVSDDYFQYSWDKSLISAYLNDETATGFLKKLENAIGSDKLVEIQICADGSISSSSVFSYGGHLKSEIDSISGASCSKYVTNKVRLITISEYDALSPYYGPESHYSLQNGGQFAPKPNITRSEESSWLYSSSIGVWWTMGAYSNSPASDVRHAHYVYTDGDLGYYYGYEYGVRPVITIRK